MAGGYYELHGKALGMHPTLDRCHSEAKSYRGKRELPAGPEAIRKLIDPPEGELKATITQLQRLPSSGSCAPDFAQGLQGLIAGENRVERGAQVWLSWEDNISLIANARTAFLSSIIWARDHCLAALARN